MTDAAQALTAACYKLLDGPPFNLPLSEEPECVEALVNFVAAALRAAEARGWNEVRKELRENYDGDDHWPDVMNWLDIQSARRAGKGA